MLKIEKITIEYQIQPVGLDIQKPAISYVLSSDRQDVVQKEYQIKVFSGNDCVYDTDIQQSEQSILHIYKGKKLKPRTKYVVEIYVKDNYGDIAVSKTTFETGLMLNSKNITKTKFITHAFKEETICPILVREFSISKKVIGARIYATALGMYDLTLNGKRVGDIYFTPYWTNYNTTLEYQTYDVTDMIDKTNRLEMTLADGWYKGALSWFEKTNIYGDRLAGWLELYLYYDDGTFEKIVTDASWHSKKSQIMSSSIYNGEIINTSFDNDELYPAIVYEHNLAVLKGQQNEPVRKREIFTVKNKTTSPKGEQILDFGQNLTGWVEFEYKGKKGQVITLKYAETLDRYGNMYTDNLRKAKATDVFICNGELQHFNPRFTFHGYRFCSVEGIDNLDTSSFKSIAMYSDLNDFSSFECSDNDINQLYSNQKWSNRGNYLDLPTDCPQRDERLGWTADVMVYSRTAGTNFDVFLFLRKWLRDLKSEQTYEFGVPQIIPNVLNKTDGGNAVWADAATFVPYTLFELYGDKRILEEQFESMCGWVDWITRNTDEDGLWKSGFQFGDWLALDMDEFSDRTGATDKYFIANVFYLRSTEIVKETAKILNKNKEYRKYSNQYNSLLKTIRREYFTLTGRMVTETQTAYVLALKFNVVPENFHNKILNALADDIKQRGHFMTGFVGTPYLCFVLTDNGRQDIVDLILRREKYPSWIYPIRMGATTMWERWNSLRPDGTFNSVDMNSFNHYAYGSIGEWLYRRLAGIDSVLPGYKKIAIKPIFSKGFYDYSRGTNSASDERKPVWVDDISYVNSTINTPYGLIKSRINYKTKCLEVEIPVNACAEVYLPNGAVESIGSGKYTFNF